MFAAGGVDAIALLSALRATPAALRADARAEKGVDASCVVATGCDLAWDDDGDAAGYLSLTTFKSMWGADRVERFVDGELRQLAARAAPLLNFAGDSGRLAARYRALGGDVEEVSFRGGDDALLRRCAVDELARRGARADRVLWLTATESATELPGLRTSA